MTYRVLLVALLALACSDDTVQVVVRNLDGPTDIAFACVGDLRLDSGDVVRTAQPLGSCTQRQAGEVPEGQEDVVAPDIFAFVLQQTRGTVAVVDTLVGSVTDTDPFAPGRNAIPIGTLPVGLVNDQSGCFVLTANAGSCDLSVLDAASAVSSSQPTTVNRVPIQTSTGQILSAKPRAIEVGQAFDTDIGVACPAQPSGNVYVTFPECGIVAAIEASSGTVVAGIRLLEDGLVELIDGNFSCPAQCGATDVIPTGLVPDAGLPDGGPPDAGVPDPIDAPAGLPVAIHLDTDANRLFIGSQNNSVLTVVALDENGLPASSQSVALEGDVGIAAIKTTGVVTMGGTFDSVGQVGVDFEFAYVIATDGSVRVVDIGGMRECDTQVDPRYLRDITNIEYLACMYVGDAATPPRRAGARGPGIRLPNDAVPLDLEVVVTSQAEASGQPSPQTMLGTFAFVTASDGNTFVINIDDDNYPDFEEPGDPARVWMTLAVPHQLRDFLQERDFVLTTSCNSPSDEPFEYSPRLVGDVGRGFGTRTDVADQKAGLLPDLRRVECRIEEGTGDDTNLIAQASVSELGISAPVAIRERTYPDLLSARNEDWFISWEGSLSLDGPGVAIDGRPIRSGVFQSEQGVTRVGEAARPFCALGVEPFDVLEVVGCDPTRGNLQCGIDETCYVHPDTPTVIDTGLCLPTAEVDSLAGVCRDFLITERRYSVTSVTSGELTVGERARILKTSPIDGCTSDDECSLLAEEEDRISLANHPVEGVLPAGGARDYEWTCTADPTRAGDVSRCVMACETREDCEPGTHCSGGVCVLGALPPPQCTQAVQRYRLRAGESFAVVGSESGYVHPWIAAEDGSCVIDAEASPLTLGRIPLDAPPCEGDEFTDIATNPCSTTVEMFDVFTPYEVRESTCVALSQEFRTRELPAIRFSNGSFTVHLVGLETTGDAECNGDGAGELPAYSPVFQDYTLGFSITGGFIPQFVSARSYIAEFPVRIRRGPAGLLWIMDQGDDRDPRSATRGRVLTINPENASNGFEGANPLF